MQNEDENSVVFRNQHAVCCPGVHADPLPVLSLEEALSPPELPGSGVLYHLRLPFRHGTIGSRLNNHRANLSHLVAVRDLTKSTSRLLVTILLGNNVVNILGASVASALAVRLFGLELGITVATFVMTLLVLIFCEVLPKAVAARHPRGVSRVVGLPLYLIHQCLRPVHALFDRVLEPLVLRITGGLSVGDKASKETHSSPYSWR